MLYFILGTGYQGIELFALVLAFCISICIAMTAHEFAHGKTADLRGDNTARLSGRLTLNPFAHMTMGGLICFLLFGFGWAKPVPINPSNFRNYKKDATWVLFSGVLTNFVLAIVFSGLYYFLAPILLASGNVLLLFIYFLLYFSFMLNLALAVFNLLPIPPLDGFNILTLWTKYDNKFVQFLNQYGIILLLLFILPIFGGRSILSLFYDTFTTIFVLFWGLLV